MASVDMCEHDWPGSGCEECRKLRERPSEPSGRLDGARGWIERGEDRVFPGVRSAAQAAAAPIIPAVTVWFGAMPESNGKSNWTAMLIRRQGSLIEAMTAGVTLERSEYKDRVRYVADRTRFLLGELTEEPDILAYDPDLTQAVMAAQDEVDPCFQCDGTGDVHGLDGEWRGYCGCRVGEDLRTRCIARSRKGDGHE